MYPGAAGNLPLTTDGSTNHSGYCESHRGEHQLLILSFSGEIPTYSLIAFRLICAAGYKFYLITPGVIWFVLIFQIRFLFLFQENNSRICTNGLPRARWAMAQIRGSLFILICH